LLSKILFPVAALDAFILPYIVPCNASMVAVNGTYAHKLDESVVTSIKHMQLQKVFLLYDTNHIFPVILVYWIGFGMQ